VVPVNAAWKWIAVSGWTAGIVTYAMARQLAGEHGAVLRYTPTWARVAGRIWGLSVSTYGAEGIDPSRPCVFMANHESYADVLALILGLPVCPGFLAKKELRRIPFLGPAMAASNHVFIDRGRRARAIHAIDDAARQVRDGSSIVIFPEGTRGDGRCVRTFKKGGFHLAKQAGVPIVPVGIRGTTAALAAHSLRVASAAVAVHIGEAVAESEIANMGMDALVERVRQRVSELSALPLCDRA
jgi:1-acyl-sn-glycerol-3-phosphate acyltransferase